MVESNLRVVFIGARGSGKSSTLSSMIDSLNRIHSDIRVKCADELTEDKMRKKSQELINIFSTSNINNEKRFDEEQGSDRTDFNDYNYTVEIKKKLKINLCCTDIDVSEKETDNILFGNGTYVQLSDVIIIAIDTPQLVENGYRGKIANRVNDVIDLIKDANVFNNSKQLLLVPMKCERYVHSGQMNYVVDAIKNTYADLLHYWKSKCNIPAYIVPVQTLGDLEFSHISGGERFYYKYVGNRNYSPRWCEQPMIYAIRYLINKNIGNLK